MSPRMRTLPIVLATCLLAANPARALVIKNFSDATDSRFTSNTSYSSWIDTAPANPTFQYSSYDFSGVGWRYNSSDATASRQAIALVSAQYALTAWHVAPTTSESVRFRSTSGSVLTYGINSVTRIGSTDLALIRLQTAVAPTDNINRLQIADFGSSWLGEDLLLYGRGSPGDFTSHRVGTGSVFATANITVSGSTGWTLQSRYVTATATTGEAYFQTGDSGSPMLAFYSGQIALAGINWAVASGTGYYDSIATRVADYDTSIDAILSSDGQSLSVVPEPATTALCLLASVMVWAGRRRRVQPQRCSQG